MTRKERFAAILAWFRENRPAAQTELRFGSPFQLLVAVVLSAQCTDKRVNLVTPALFERFPGPESLAAASFEEVFPYVKSVSYPNSKATHLIGLAQKLVADFGGSVPEDIDALMTLPGVGRKTANVIASVVYDRPVIAVDTHVFRVSHRIGLASDETAGDAGKAKDAGEKNVLATEQELMKILPGDRWTEAHHSLIWHGRKCCTARNPKCGACPIEKQCRKNGV